MADIYNNAVLAGPTCCVETSKWSSRATARYIEDIGVHPYDVAIGSKGDLFMSDYYGHQIVTGIGDKILAGGQSGFTDGQGAEAKFSSATRIASDRKGNLFVPDLTRIRKVTESGAVSTLAGTDEKAYVDGDRSEARFSDVSSVAPAPDGSLFVADFYRIRRISTSGAVTTIAGGVFGGDSDGPGENASFNYPLWLTVDATGTLYVADSGNCRIRKIAKISASIEN